MIISKFRHFFFSLALLSAFYPKLASAEVPPPIIIPHYAIGDGWTTKLVLLNGTGLDQAFGIDLMDVNGVPVMSEQGQVAPGGVFTKTFSGTRLVTGHVELTARNSFLPDFFTEFFGIRAYVVFTYKKGGVQYEAAALSNPPEDEKRIILDSVEGYKHGIGVYNSSRFAASVKFDVRNQTGRLVRTGTFVLDSHQQMSFTLEDKYPDLAGVIGTITFTDVAPREKVQLSVVGFRFNPMGQFTNIPVD